MPSPLSITSFPILSLDLFFLLSWESWSNQKITSISSHCHMSLRTSIFTHKPRCPSLIIIKNCFCSSDQSSVCTLDPISSGLLKHKSPSISPSHLDHFLAIYWVVPINFKTHFVTFTSKEKKKKILRTLVPSSSDSQILPLFWGPWGSVLGLLLF